MSSPSAQSNPERSSQPKTAQELVAQRTKEREDELLDMSLQRVKIQNNPGQFIKEGERDTHYVANEGDKRATVIYHTNGCVKREVWFLGALFHRDNDRPAIVNYYENGSIKNESWRQEDKMHRDGGEPARIDCDENGNIAYKAWYLGGQLIKKEVSERPSVITK